jgi:hypothetical protein
MQGIYRNPVWTKEEYLEIQQAYLQVMRNSYCRGKIFNDTKRHVLKLTS